MPLSAENRSQGGRARARNIEPRTSSPVLKEIFNTMVERNVTVKEMSRRINHHSNIVSLWRTGRSTPSILSVEEMAGQIGFRLALVPIEETPVDG